MSWINKLTYYPNGKVPEDPNNEKVSGTSYEIGTTFDKVFYKNKEGAITNFSLMNFIDVIKDFFSRKGFMIWAEDTPQNNSNIIEWYQTQTLKDPVLFNLEINQSYANNEEMQQGYYEIIGTGDSPNFSNGERNFEFFIKVNNNNKLSSKIELDPDCDPRTGDTSEDENFYFYQLKSKILGIDTSYQLRIQVRVTETDDRKITVIEVLSDNGWKEFYPEKEFDLNFTISKYYTVTFIRSSEGENINDNIVKILYVCSGNSIADDQRPDPPEKEGFNAYWSTEKNGSSAYSFDDTTITNDLTLYAVYTSKTPSENPEEPTPENPEEPTPENLDESSQG